MIEGGLGLRNKVTCKLNDFYIQYCHLLILKTVLRGHLWDKEKVAF